MKWINLAERHPPSLGEAIVRRVHGDFPYTIFHSYRYNDDGTISMWGGDYAPITRNTSEFEWLDESESTIENPIQQVAPGVYKIGNAYTGEAGAIMANRHIIEAFAKADEVFDLKKGLRYFWNGEKWIPYYTEEDVDRLLAEQHRNTVMDAFEAIKTWNNRAHRVSVDALKDDIFYLKQRKP